MRVKKALYVRIAAHKHRLLAQLVASRGMTLSTLVEQMVDQLLYQAVPNFQAPEWLLDAVASGEIPIQKYTEDDTEDSGVLNRVGHG